MEISREKILFLFFEESKKYFKVKQSSTVSVENSKAKRTKRQFK